MIQLSRKRHKATADLYLEKTASGFTINAGIMYTQSVKTSVVLLDWSCMVVTCQLFKMNISKKVLVPDCVINDYVYTIDKLQKQNQCLL